MQQRSLSSLRAVDDQCIVISLTPESHSPTRRSEDDSGGGLLPISDPRSGIRKRDISRSKLAERWIHAIPLVLVLVICILWWFTYPVNSMNKDGGITAFRRSEFPQPPKYTHIELATIGATAMQIASGPLNLSNGGARELRSMPSKVDRHDFIT